MIFFFFFFCSKHRSLVHVRTASVLTSTHDLCFRAKTGKHEYPCKPQFYFLDGDVPRRPSYGVYISQLIRFARVNSHVDDFITRNKCLTAKLLKQGYRYHKLRKAFSKFYRRHYELISKFNVGLKSLLHQGLNQNFMVT